MAATGTFLLNVFGVPGGIIMNPGMTGIQQDSSPPNLNNQLPFNDNVPFTYAGGVVESDHGPTMQVALAKLSDGSGTLTVGDQTPLAFAPGELKHVSESEGALTLSGGTFSNSLDLFNRFDWNREVAALNPDGLIGKIVINDDDTVGQASSFDGVTLGGGIGTAFGSSLGRLLGGNSLVGQAAAGTVIGTIGKEIGNALTFSGTYSLDLAVKDAFGTLSGGTNVGALPSAAIGAASSLLMAELAHALNLTGFEGGLFTTVGTSITSQLVTNAYGMMTGATWGENQAYTMFTGFDPLSMASNIGGAVAGYFGSTLAANIMAPHHAEGAIGEQVGSSVGGAVGAFLMMPIPVIGPIVGSFLGSFLGGIAGSFFGDLAGNDPEAHGKLEFNTTTHRFEAILSSFWGDHGASGNTFAHIANYQPTWSTSSRNSAARKCTAR